MPPEFVIAIDGPAGAGKSTVARSAAAKLYGFRYLDTLYELSDGVHVWIAAALFESELLS